jgi:hypothetical protein
MFVSESTYRGRFEVKVWASCTRFGTITNQKNTPNNTIIPSRAKGVDHGGSLSRSRPRDIERKTTATSIAMATRSSTGNSL